MLEMAKELRLAKEEASYATQRLADVILDLHRGKPNETRSPGRQSPQKKNQSPKHLSSLRTLNTSPIIKKSRNAPEKGSRLNDDDDDEDEEEEDDEYSYDEDDFDEESHLNISMGNPLTKKESEKKKNTKKKDYQHDNANDENDEKDTNTIHPPHSSLRNSSEFDWSSKHAYNSSQPRYQPDSRYSREGASADHLLVNKQSFDGVLRASQSLFQRQLASLRESLDTLNHSSSNRRVASSLAHPHYPAEGHNSWASPRRNVSSSLSDIKGGFKSQRDVQQDKLRNALLVVDPTLSQDDISSLMEKYS